MPLNLRNEVPDVIATLWVLEGNGDVRAIRFGPDDKGFCTRRSASRESLFRRH
jgi:hypothetical protein